MGILCNVEMKMSGQHLKVLNLIILTVELCEIYKRASENEFSFSFEDFRLKAKLVERVESFEGKIEFPEEDPWLVDIASLYAYKYRDTVTAFEAAKEYKWEFTDE